MRKFLPLIAGVLVGCSSGANPSSITYGATQYRAIGPQQTYGVRPEVKRALMAPTGVVTCITNGAAKVLVTAAETVNCIAETLTPPEVVPVQAYEPVDNLGACAPVRGACTSGACAPPPVAAPATRGACLPPPK